MPEYYKTDKGYYYKKTQKGGTSRISVKEYDNAMKNKRKIKQKGGTLGVCTGNIQKLFGYFKINNEYKFLYNNKEIDENKAQDIFTINDKKLNDILTKNRRNIPENLNDLILKRNDSVSGNNFRRLVIPKDKINSHNSFNLSTFRDFGNRPALNRNVRKKIKEDYLPKYRGLPVKYSEIRDDGWSISKNYNLYFYISDINLSEFNLPNLNEFKIKHILILWQDESGNIEEYNTIVIKHPNGLFEIFKDFRNLLKEMVENLPEKTCIQFKEFRPYLYGSELNVFRRNSDKYDRIRNSDKYDRIIDNISIDDMNLTRNLFKDKKYDYPFTGSTFLKTKQYKAYNNNNNNNNISPEDIRFLHKVTPYFLHKVTPYTREYLQEKRKQMKKGNNGVKNTKTFDSIRILNYYYILFKNY